MKVAKPKPAFPVTPERVLRIPETEHLTGFCDMQLRRMERAGTFPRRFKLNPDGGKFGAVGHNFAEVTAWLEQRRASRLQDTEQDELRGARA